MGMTIVINETVNSPLMPLKRYSTMPPANYWRRVAPDRWVVTGSKYALEAQPDGSYQFFSSGKPVFTVTTLHEADQALADLIDVELDLRAERL